MQFALPLPSIKRIPLVQTAGAYKKNDVKGVENWVSSVVPPKLCSWRKHMLFCFW